MADNRQFTDHNSIGNVNVYYKDRQLKERTAVSNAASIANLKFLLTTGDDEGFRTAIKSYIDEAIRSALGALVDNLDKGTGVSRILGTDSSHDLGTITPANLASVLGVMAKQRGFPADLNDAGNRCGYFLYTNLNIPVQNTNGYLLSVTSDSTHCLQFAVVESDNFNTLYKRVKWGDWKPWIAVQ